MNKSISAKSKTPLQFRVFHSLLGIAVFFSLITIPAESQVINLFGVHVLSEFLWWPIVFCTLQLINNIYGFLYLKQTVYLIIAFRIVYLLFLKLAIWLPSSSFWKLQTIYTYVLGRDFSYLLMSSIFLWGSTILFIGYFRLRYQKFLNVLFLASLMIFCFLDFFLINPNRNTEIIQLFYILISYCVINFFSGYLEKNISKIEHIKNDEKNKENKQDKFKYHHILFCSSIVFFIASKTMAAKFISVGFLTINVGGIVFSLAYIVADIMTDVYGIERTKQMVYFVIFCNLLFVFDIWITNLLAIDEQGEFKTILHNQFRMFLASGVAYYIGINLNSITMSIIKNRQKKRGISLKKEFIYTVWVRVATSAALGIIIDVSLFSIVAFYEIVPTERLSQIVMFEDLYKISYEVLLAPLSVLLIYFLKVKEKIDIYDELSNLNPFRVNTRYSANANKFNDNYLGKEKE